ncbi:MAG: FIST C-terminal domain-containing protein [Chitinophagaceae bacterium]|jgi:hypothetical protein|nr:FIST C-terminal domain-containing protein [Chitinophagaceae bacterium]
MKSFVFNLEPQTLLNISNEYKAINPQLLLVFCERNILENRNVYQELHQLYPTANVILCTTSGEIFQKYITNNSTIVAALEFEKTALHFSTANIQSFNNSYELGKFAAQSLPQENLKYVLVISDGNKINGTELTEAITDTLGNNVLVTGGLAGDQARFEKTLVGFNDHLLEGNLVLAGFYGNNIQVSHGLKGGWDVFGPERTITKSSGNVLYEIDHQNALDLYKKYLGKYAAELPGSALLFPLAIKNTANDEPLVRTILSIDEQASSMTFAGNMPLGSGVRFMKANFDKLIQSAGIAANNAIEQNNHAPNFALFISCVGRKLALGNRAEEEVEAAADLLGNANIAGFYSYGEISPHQNGTCSNLHNQTITITTFSEQ